MGFHVSGDAYTRRIDDITVDLSSQVVRYIGDSLLWDDNIADAFWHTFEYLKTCSENRIVFTKEKFKFVEESIDFAGFNITTNEYKPLPEILETIKNFPTPKNITKREILVQPCQPVRIHIRTSTNYETIPQSSFIKVIFWDSIIDYIFQKSKTKNIELRRRHDI